MSIIGKPNDVAVNTIIQSAESNNGNRVNRAFGINRVLKVSAKMISKNLTFKNGAIALGAATVVTVGMYPGASVGIFQTLMVLGRASITLAHLILCGAAMTIGGLGLAVKNLFGSGKKAGEVIQDVINSLSLDKDNATKREVKSLTPSEMEEIYKEVLTSNDNSTKEPVTTAENKESSTQEKYNKIFNEVQNETKLMTTTKNKEPSTEATEEKYNEIFNEVQINNSGKQDEPTLQKRIQEAIERKKTKLEEVKNSKPENLDRNDSKKEINKNESSKDQVDGTNLSQQDMETIHKETVIFNEVYRETGSQNPQKPQLQYRQVTQDQLAKLQIRIQNLGREKQRPLTEQEVSKLLKEDNLDDPQLIEHLVQAVQKARPRL